MSWHQLLLTVNRCRICRRKEPPEFLNKPEKTKKDIYRDDKTATPNIKKLAGIGQRDGKSSFYNY